MVNDQPEVKKRRGRGKSKIPALKLTSIRLPVFVLDYFKQTFPNEQQAKMRAVLVDHVVSKLKQQGAKND